MRDKYQLLIGDFTKLTIPSSVDIIITSPPYNLDVEYDNWNDNISENEYAEFTKQWLTKAYDILPDGGRLIANIPMNTSYPHNTPFYAKWQMIASECEFTFQTLIAWDKCNVKSRTTWGSFQSASAPFVASPVELIAVMYKGNQWRRDDEHKREKEYPPEYREKYCITKDEFIAWTYGLWSINGESATHIGHPAPFPYELAYRLVKLYSFPTDIILDPFCGSGTTGVAALKLDRQFIGVDISEKYLALARKRIEAVAIQPMLI